MIPDSEYVERIVKGIHALNNPDATVDWNVEIEGRQFDVVMRFTKGTSSPSDTGVILVEF